MAPAKASLEQALFWRGIYTEILEMEESVLARIRQLMAKQSPQARREVELTNVPVVVARSSDSEPVGGSGIPGCAHQSESLTS